MARKRGKLSTEEEEFIVANSDKMPTSQIALQLNRTEETIKKFLDSKSITFKSISEDSFDDVILSKDLQGRPYWNELTEQFTKNELDYFVVTWVNVVKQFKQDILYTEELQIKQWITLEILGNRVMRERKKSIEQVDRLQNMLDSEYGKEMELRNDERMLDLETELSHVRNSLSSYTTEHAKILDKIKNIQTDLKANRADRIKKIEDSKSSFAGFLRSLEDKDIRERIGEEMEIMRLAKDKAKEILRMPIEYEDDIVDIPYQVSDKENQEETQDE